MKAYCMNCGALMEFQAGNKPKFCSSCGANTSTGKVAPVKKVVAKPVVEQVNLEDEEENLSVPEISGLDFDIQGSLKVQKASIGDLMSVSDESGNEFIPTEMKSSAPKQSKKKFMEQFQREAGSLREGG